MPTNPSPDSRALANLLSNTFGGNGRSTLQQTEDAAELIEQWLNERIHDYELRTAPPEAGKAHKLVSEHEISVL